VLGAHGDQAGVDDGVDDGWGVGDLLVGFLVVAFEPCLNVEVSWSVEWDRVVVE